MRVCLLLSHNIHSGINLLWVCARNVEIKVYAVRVCVNKFSRNLMFHCYKLNAAIVLVGQRSCCRRRLRNEKIYIMYKHNSFGIASYT